ncbi:hypothetical protein BJ741DRAFT_585931 [Chytriomyces cf. hyalinus JEL632]|nr:hypothetical protein BJ741DRAFT_585931 [Chytriomyces cf. hyalinus JEL632]
MQVRLHLVQSNSNSIVVVADTGAALYARIEIVTNPSAVVRSIPGAGTVTAVMLAWRSILHVDADKVLMAKGSIPGSRAKKPAPIHECIHSGSATFSPGPADAIYELLIPADIPLSSASALFSVSHSASAHLTFKDGSTAASDSIPFTVVRLQTDPTRSIKFNVSPGTCPDDLLQYEMLIPSSCANADKLPLQLVLWPRAGVNRIDSVTFLLKEVTEYNLRMTPTVSKVTVADVLDNPESSNPSSTPSPAYPKQQHLKRITIEEAVAKTTVKLNFKVDPARPNPECKISSVLALKSDTCGPDWYLGDSLVTRSHYVKATVSYTVERPGGGGITGWIQGARTDKSFSTTSAICVRSNSV